MKTSNDATDESVSKDSFVHLKNAKRDPDARPAKGGATQEPDYPFGTRVRLSGDHAKKVFGNDPPTVGDEHEIHAKGKIASTSQRDGEDPEVEIQITHMKRPQPKERSVRDDVEAAAAATEKKQAMSK